MENEFNHFKFWLVYIFSAVVLTVFILPTTDSGVLFFITLGAMVPIPVVLLGRKRFHIKDSILSAVIALLLGESIWIVPVTLSILLSR